MLLILLILLILFLLLMLLVTRRLLLRAGSFSLFSLTIPNKCFIFRIFNINSRTTIMINPSLIYNHPCSSKKQYWSFSCLLYSERLSAISTCQWLWRFVRMVHTLHTICLLSSMLTSTNCLFHWQVLRITSTIINKSQPIKIQLRNNISRDSNRRRICLRLQKFIKDKVLA